MQVNDLTVEVGKRDGVAVNEGQTSDTGARQCLASVTAYASNAKNRHVSGVQFLQRRATQKDRGAAFFFATVIHTVLLRIE
jgi:hypothetical protein